LKIESTHDDRFIFIQSEQALAVFNFETFTLCWYKLKVNEYHIVGNYLWFSLKDKLVLTHDPFDDHNIIITGPSNSKYDYFSYIYKIMQGKSPDWKKDFDDWYISKYGISTLHLYTYFGL